MITTIEIIEPEDTNHLPKIVQKLNERFTTQEQAEQRLELNCLEIAQELGGTVEIKDCIVFNFSHANF